MADRVAVVDYGIGNVFSVCNALREIGADVTLTGKPAELLAADRLILPGVGAFARAVEALDRLGLSDTLRTYRELGRPFLGICIGMQVLMETGEEFGCHDGLGLLPGRVTRIDDRSIDGVALRVPHISWATLEPGETHRAGWQGTVLEDLRPGHDTLYFVHSFHCRPTDPADTLAQASYGGLPITAAVARDNLMGVQFHPERSGPTGHKVLRTFMGLR